MDNLTTEVDLKLIKAKKLLKRSVNALAVSGQDSLATNMMIGRLAAEIYEFLDEN